MITAHIRLKPVAFTDDSSLSLAWRFRMSLAQLDNDAADDLTNTHRIANVRHGLPAHGEAIGFSPPGPIASFDNPPVHGRSL